ncbi:MAG: metalloregulator ArsR/SmtB family transcription factor [Candidatus Promineifilaceae bacterium]|nr:metalloregulator ArsR/SmtB family transcription factor [Candidatus Promineifilaceae bacterium]
MKERPQQKTDPWHTFGHPKRRQIIKLLRGNALTTSELCEHFEVSRYAIMKHLNVLEEDGVVKVRREGRNRWNELDRQGLADLSAALLQNEDGQWLAELVTDATSSEPREIVVDVVRTLAASAQRVFVALTAEVDAWWIRREGTKRVRLEPWPNGRLLEEVDRNGHGNLLGTVTRIRPAEDLWLEGPLFVEPSPFVSRVQLHLDGGGQETRLHVRHTLFGGESPSVVEVCRQGWEALLAELANYLENGRNGEETEGVLAPAAAS